MQNLPLIIYDGPCVLCNGFVRFVLKHDEFQQLYFTPLQSRVGQSYATESNSGGASILLVAKDGHVFNKSDAFLEIIRLCNWPWRAFYFFRFIPRRIRDLIYSTVAINRYSIFGKNPRCILPPAGQRSRFIEFPFSEKETQAS